MQIGSAVLFGFYLVIKFVSVEWLNWLLGWTFVISGIVSVWKVCEYRHFAKGHGY